MICNGNLEKTHTLCDLRVKLLFLSLSQMVTTGLQQCHCRRGDDGTPVVFSCVQHGKAALHLAAEHGHEEIADILLSHKAFVNAKTKLGMTPLHLGAQSGSTQLVQLLVETHQASIDALSLVRTSTLCTSV